MKNSREIEGKWNQLNRILISYIDFQQAHEIAALILEENLHEHYPREQKVKLEALNLAMVVAYSRPFSGNRGLPDLPNRFVRHLTGPEKELHDVILNDRNTGIAHSDSEAWAMSPQYVGVGGRSMLVPLHRGVHRPLLRGPTERLQALAEKQMDACFSAREGLEEELRDHIPTSG